MKYLMYFFLGTDNIINVRMDGVLEMRQSTDGGRNYFYSAGLGRLSEQADTLFFQME